MLLLKANSKAKHLLEESLAYGHTMPPVAFLLVCNTMLPIGSDPFICCCRLLMRSTTRPAAGGIAAARTRPGVDATSRLGGLRKSARMGQQMPPALGGAGRKPMINISPGRRTPPASGAHPKGCKSFVSLLIAITCLSSTTMHPLSRLALCKTAIFPTLVTKRFFKACCSSFASQGGLKPSAEDPPRSLANARMGTAINQKTTRLVSNKYVSASHSHRE